MKQLHKVTKRSDQPYIGIGGSWLQDAGFSVGSNIELEVEDQRLTITKTDLESRIKKPSCYESDYRGYTVTLRLERDHDYQPRKILGADEAYRFLKPLQTMAREVLLSVMLDCGNQVVGVYEVSKGIQDFSPIYTSEIFKAAFMANSSSIILVHNHTTGTPKPSAQDIEITASIRRLIEPLGIQLMDHLIIGSDDYASLKELGYL